MHIHLVAYRAMTLAFHFTDQSRKLTKVEGFQIRFAFSEIFRSLGQGQNCLGQLFFVEHLARAGIKLPVRDLLESPASVRGIMAGSCIGASGQSKLFIDMIDGQSGSGVILRFDPADIDDVGSLPEPESIPFEDDGLSSSDLFLINRISGLDT